MSESEQKYTIYLFDNKLLLCEGKMEEFGSIKDNQQEWSSGVYVCGVLLVMVVGELHTVFYVILSS